MHCVYMHDQKQRIDYLPKTLNQEIKSQASATLKVWTGPQKDLSPFYY